MEQKQSVAHKTIMKVDNKRVFVKSNIPVERTEAIQNTLKDIDKRNPMVCMHSVYGGGFKPRNSNKNIKRQLNILQDRARQKV